MTSEQRAAVGSLLMKWAAFTSPMAYVHHKVPDKGWPAGDTSEQIRQRSWSFDDYDDIEEAGNAAYSELLDTMEEYWPQLFGWSAC
jgi:hypothetical protein